MLTLATKHTSKVMFLLGCHSTPTTCISPQFSYSPNTLSIWLLEPLAWFLGVLCMSDQPACGHVTNAFATGCIGSNLDCPSARGICPHICLTVDGKGTDPRRTSPLNALALMSIILLHDGDTAFHTTARTEKLCKLLLKTGLYFWLGYQW